MNVEQANGIDLSVILEILGFHPVERKGFDLWYLSPFRNEETASFHVHATKNIWYDFGAARGGKVIDFVCAWLGSHFEDHTVTDALRWLDNMHPVGLSEIPKEKEPVAEMPALEIRKVTNLQNPVFINYLDSRGIPMSLAKKYLKEAHVRNRKTGKSFYAMALENECGGIELRNNVFKGCIGTKGVTFIRGRKTLPDEVHVFEGVMDFLSALIRMNTTRFEGDTIILNSVSCLSKSLPYILNYSYTKLYSWLDNDHAGECAARALKSIVTSQGNFTFHPMNETYAGHKDVNEWHMNKLELKHAKP